MEISVRGRHNSIPEALREFATEKAEHLARYLSTITRIDVELLRDGKPKSDGEYLVHVAVATSGPVFRARASAGDAHSAIDQAMERLERQLKEFKRRRSGRPLHSRPRAQPADSKGTGPQGSGEAGRTESTGPELPEEDGAAGPPEPAGER